MLKQHGFPLKTVRLWRLPLQLEYGDYPECVADHTSHKPIFM